MFKNKIKFMIASSALLASTMFSPNMLPLIEKNEVFAQTMVSKTHTVKKGETLYRIGKNYNVSVVNLKKWNNLKSNTISTGSVLRVSAPAAVENKTPDKKTTVSKIHSVKKGETLYRMAVNNKVTVSDIKKWNKLKSNDIYVGQKLYLEPKKKSDSIDLGDSFKTYRFYDTNVHVYVSRKNASLGVTKGVQGKLEPLSHIKVPNEIAKVNLGMFSSAFEHGGMFLVNGAHYQKTNERYLSLIFNKTGKIDIDNFGKQMSDEALNRLRKDTNFVVGTSYSLVQDGKKNLENSYRFSHSNQRNPRTMFGQAKDGRFIMAVTDGRVQGSKGLTASQSADIMLKLGALEAVNLDGGGSSTLIVNGKIKNKLDGGERKIGSALVILK